MTSTVTLRGSEEDEPMLQQAFAGLTLRDGRIARFDGYFDREVARRELGLSQEEAAYWSS